MTVEGIKLTSELIENIQWFQLNEGAISAELRVIDKAIDRIAREADGGTPDDAADALSVIAGLCHLKEIIASLEGKE